MSRGLIDLPVVVSGYSSRELTIFNSHIYTPQNNISYKIDDGTGGFAIGTVTIVVTPTNDPPIAKNDNITVNEDSLETNIKNIVLWLCSEFIFLIFAKRIIFNALR